MSETATRPQPKVARRKDPAPRHLESVRSGRLIGADPNMKYVFVAKSNTDPETSVEAYEDRGYSIVRKEAGGVRIAGTRERSDGEAIEWKGMVLMCIPIADAQRQFQEGSEGDSGQAYADMIEKRIRNPKASTRAAVLEGNFNRRRDGGNYFGVDDMTKGDAREAGIDI